MEIWAETGDRSRDRRSEQWTETWDLSRDLSREQKPETGAVNGNLRLEQRTETGPVTKTKTVLEDIQIFATDKLRASLNTDQADVDAKNISLLVSPEQANLLKLAETKGDLSF